MMLRGEKLHLFGQDGKNPHIASKTLANFYSNGLYNAIFMKNGGIGVVNSTMK